MDQLQDLFNMIFAVGMGVLIAYAIIVIIMLVSYWMIFEKAGQPGWAILVPFYNSYVLIVNVCQLPPVWFWLTLVPCVNIVVAIGLMFMIPFKLAEKFGKDAGFGVGLLLLGFVFLPMLAFGSARYQTGRGGRRRSDDYDDDDDDDDDDRPRKKKRNDNW